MTAPYESIIHSLRPSFPQPVSDRVHDAYFVFSFLRALDQVDRLKSVTPLLGKPETLDYQTARQRRVPTSPASLEHVSEELVEPRWRVGLRRAAFDLLDDCAEGRDRVCSARIGRLKQTRIAAVGNRAATSPQAVAL